MVEVHSGPRDDTDPLARMPLPNIHKKKKRFVGVELGANIMTKIPISQKLKAIRIGEKCSISFERGGETK
jgi:hypothetical protein